MKAGIFHGLYIVSYASNRKTLRQIDYIAPAVLKAHRDVFAPRKKLSPKAKRAGWQGFTLVLSEIPKRKVERIYP